MEEFQELVECDLETKSLWNLDEKLFEKRKEDLSPFNSNLISGKKRKNNSGDKRQLPL